MRVKERERVRVRVRVGVRGSKRVMREEVRERERVRKEGACRAIVRCVTYEMEGKGRGSVGCR